LINEFALRFHLSDKHDPSTGLYLYSDNYIVDDFTKAQAVEAIKKFIPNFDHKEKRKNLDQKM